jgi:uncharacterized protein YbjQ (UPF0145 family)
MIAGTNIFSDVFAGFSDIFGGRSSSYQKQLSSIYNEAIERLQYKTYQLGGNCIVGLKIDIDEISGQGKSMFMITAIGTAVLLETGQDNSAKRIAKEEGGISVNQIRDAKAKKDFLKKIEKGEVELTEKAWEYILQNRLKEVLPFLFGKFTAYYDGERNHPNEVLKNYKERFILYFKLLDRETQINFLYRQLRDPELKYFSLKLVLKLIEDEDLLDLTKVEAIMKIENVNVSKRALSVLSSEKPYYKKEDIAQLKHLSIIIDNHFNKTGKITSKKQMLSSKETEVWECECGKINSMDYLKCLRCQKDIYGFEKGMINPKEAKEMISNKIDIIESIVDESLK